MQPDAGHRDPRQERLNSSWEPVSAPRRTGSGGIKVLSIHGAKMTEEQELFVRLEGCLTAFKSLVFSILTMSLECLEHIEESDCNNKA
jgi:hypothetical protein